MKFGKWARGVAAGIGLFAASEGMAAEPGQPEHGKGKPKAVEVAGKNILVDEDGLIVENGAPDSTNPNYNDSKTEVTIVDPAHIDFNKKNQSEKQRLASEQTKINDIRAQLKDSSENSNDTKVATNK